MIDTLPLATTIVAGVFATICLVTDLRQRKIFNVVTYPAFAVYAEDAKQRQEVGSALAVLRKYMASEAADQASLGSMGL